MGILLAFFKQMAWIVLSVTVLEIFFHILRLLPARDARIFILLFHPGWAKMAENIG
jgi:hypothetical protein